jgi:hypothetical protein
MASNAAVAPRKTPFAGCRPGSEYHHPRWSAFWDKRYGVGRVAEDDPDSSLYAESRDLDTVISYINTNS